MATLGELSFFARPHVGAPSVAEAVRTQVTVEQLSIKGDWFGDDDAEELGAALAENSSLGTLILSKCSFGARGLRGITEGLKFSQTITKIYFTLHGTTIGDAGGEIMAKFLVSHSSFQKLGMVYCKIGALGAEAITKARKTNAILTIADYGNNIGDAGAAVLADALASTTSLEQLKVYGSSDFGLESKLAFGRAWGANLALTMDFDLSIITNGDNNTPRIREEAARVRALVLLRREKLVAFGMAMIKRLGGGPSAEEGSTTSSREASVFHYMCKDVFRLVGEAYQY